MSHLCTVEKINKSRAAGKVQRFHTLDLIRRQDVAQHSFNVANIVRLLGGSKDTILAALYHDMGEHNVGDIPSPTKRGMNEESREHVENLENEGMAMCGITSVTFPTGEVQLGLLKLADNLDGLMLCIEELQRGNIDIITCGCRYAQYCCENRELARQVVDYYLDKWRELSYAFP